MTTLLRCENISKFYDEGDHKVQVLKEVSFSMNVGELVAIVGSSGSGKSTLLHMLGGLDQPSSGKVWIQDQSLQKLSANKLASLRNQHLGFVYQFHHLMADFTALENVMMPMLIGKQNKSELSGGERQRVAIARALVNNPDLVLADEPTGNLDQKTTESIFDLIKQLNAEQNIAFLLVTHDLNLAQKLSRRFVMRDGVLREEV